MALESEQSIVHGGSAKPVLYRILSLDGGGAKGFYTLGILDEIEKNLGKPLHQCFDLIFGTSTGSIIAALLARGDTVEQALNLYKEHVPRVLGPAKPMQRSAALRQLANTVFGESKSDIFKTGIGIVATNWKEERPLIFKASVAQAHGSKGSFVPFFGCDVANAVIASCSAYPFFDTHTIEKSNGDRVELADGGFCANNPTLYAIADAILAVGIAPSQIRVISLGVGCYPEPTIWKKVGRLFGGWGIWRHALNAGFLQKLLGTNTSSMEVLRSILFKNIPTIRINEGFVEPTMATDLLEHDPNKLNRLTQKGRISYSSHEAEITKLLTS